MRTKLSQQEIKDEVDKMRQERLEKRKKKMQRTTTMLLQNIDKELHDRFKAWCSTRGYSMTGKIRQVMYELVTGKMEDQ